MAYADGDRGVGGWLAFFLVTLGIIGPAFIIITAIINLSDPTLPLAYGENWPTLRTGEIVLIAAIVSLCWFAVWRFLRVFTWTTVVIGIATLWTVALLSVFGEALLVSSVSGLDLSLILGMAAGPDLVRPFVYSTVWTLYLLLSKRVRATYGSPQAGEVSQVFE